MKGLFRKKPKRFTGVRITEKAIEIVQEDKVVQFITKGEIQFIRVGHDRKSRMISGVAIYLHVTKAQGLLVTSDMKGCKEVESYMFGLPGVNKNNIVAIMESGTVDSVDVWRRG